MSEPNTETELERLAAELRAQDNTLDNLRSALSALDDAAISVTTSDLEAIAEACEPPQFVDPIQTASGIRC